MPDNLRVTAPLTSNNKIDKQQSLRENPVLDVAGAKKTVPPIIQNQSKENLSAELLLSRDSAFGKFVQDLKQTPPLSETLQKLYYSASGTAEKNLYAKAPFQALVRLFETAEMGKQEILSSLQFQQKNLTKFSGPLFQFFRNLSLHTNDDGLTLRLAAFLKGFDAYFSAPDTTNSILKNLDAIRAQIPLSYSNQLGLLEGKIENSHSTGEAAQNLTVLTNEIIPFLSEYVKDTNDFGKSRNNIALLLHNVGRLYISSKEDVLEKFEDLLSYSKYRFNLQDNDIAMIRGLFSNEVMKGQKKGDSSFFDALISLLSPKETPNLPEIQQAGVRDACHSLLLDNSVYMPYVHLFLPICFDGQFALSEMWIEKNSPEERGAHETPSAPIRIFLRFDVRSLGVFEAAIELIQKNVRVEISYPPSFSSDKKEFCAGVQDIFRQNGFAVEAISLSDTPLQVNKKILSKIMERKNGFDVTI